ncbi:cytochrome c3 family protein [Candidatus Sulfurimonas marisnigri]|uniref:Cytochrome c3 family protein n=1 Tax=Candidatus Sulfurimonas marisnigri TaxID=2740405 RepID=A0A7S7RPJ1_9BACT|nr:cytochrome c3 family protein [Candidatus Sulfurimonas marisnigri]QOY54447.1 cytochrome c3 family protein [Candidatus Sulfurimonas marisnigri]
MNTKLKLLLASLLTTTMAFAGTSGATYGGESITATGSPHNISVRTGGATTGDNGEICVYCHTPHAANTAFSGAPLWNKDSLNKPTAGVSGYKMYGKTIGGSDNNGTVPANPSLVCLSCHDGISAVNSILNAPGSGMGGLKDGNMSMTGIGSLNGGNIGAGGSYDAGAGGADGVADLSNDHPISITYVPGRASLRTTATTLPAGDQAWLVPGAPATPKVSDLLRGSSNDQVECVSCHDPHNATGSAQGTGEVSYLRHTNKGSQLCIGCHDK